MAGSLFAYALDGLGKGMTTMGTTMSQEAAREERDRREAEYRAELQRERLAANAELQQARLDARAAAGGGGGGGGSGSRRSGGGSLAGFAEGSPEESILASKAGMTIPEYRQFRQFEQTGDDSAYRQEVTTDANDNSAYWSVPSDQPRTETTSQLPPSFAAFVKEKRATIGTGMEELYHGDDFDDVAEGRQTEYVTGALSRYEKGNDRAGSAALVGQGKDAYTGDGDAITGEVRKGTVAASKVRENDAQAASSRAAAGKYSEEARSERDGREGKGAIKQDIAAVREQRIKLSADLADLRAREKVLAETLPNSDELAGVKARREELEQQSRRLDERMEKLATKLDGPAPAPAPAAGKGKGAPQLDMTAADRIKADVRAGKITREQALAKLRSLGFK